MARNSVEKKASLLLMLLPPLFVVLFACGVLATVLAIGTTPFATIGFSFFGHFLHIPVLALALVAWGTKNYAGPSSKFISRLLLLLVIYTAAGITGWSIAAAACLVTF